MANKVIMPKQGLQMTEGTIISWLKKEGDRVNEGESLFSMETDKLTIDIESSFTGTLLKIVKGEGETVPITKTIAVIGEEGEDISDILEETDDKRRGHKKFASPRAKLKAEENGVDWTKIPGTGPEGLVIEKDVLEYIKSLCGTTSIAKADVISAPSSALQTKAGEDKPGAAENKLLTHQTGLKISKVTAASKEKDAYRNRGKRTVPLTGMRKTISHNMMKSIHNTAQANHKIKIDMTQAIALRNLLKAEEIKVSYNDIIAFACARALREYEIVNASMTGQEIEFHDYVNIGIAVAVENGLIVPVIKNADVLNLYEIAKQSRMLIEKAQEGKLLHDEYTGGTFTVTNLGMYDIDEFTAVLNPPESAILAVGKIAKIPAADENDNIIIRPVAVFTLTYDHRLIDGAPAAQFLFRLKKYLQNPYLLF